jgi:hypothetical protein
MKFQLSGKFGELSEVRNFKPHNGIDIAMPEGTELRSIADGIVYAIRDYGNANIGKGVVIKADDGNYHIYGHMSKISIEKGDPINAGDFIGESGSTGNSTGGHFHFGIQKPNGEFIDPTPLADLIAQLSGKGGGMFQGKGILMQLYDGGRLNEYDGGGGFQGYVKEKTYEVIMGVSEAIGELLYDLSGGLALIGGGLCIIFHVAGWRDGLRWTGVLFVSSLMIRYLLGGVGA